MLSYLIIAELARCWHDLDVTVNEGIKQLDTLCATQLAFLQQLLKAAQVTMPEVLPSKGIIVTTKKKLTSHRKKR
jgi:hypothetical protein